MDSCHFKFFQGASCKSPEGAGGGGEFSPHSNPPFSCRTNYGGFTNFRCKSASQGFGGGQQFCITPEMGIDIQRILSALSSFMKDGGITISVEVEAFDEFSKPTVIDSAVKRPSKLMNFKFRVGNSFSSVGGEKNNNAHGFNVPNAVHGDWNGQSPDELKGCKSCICTSPKAGDVNV